jgi:uncharacterized protein with PQ loop repeat
MDLFAILAGTFCTVSFIPQIIRARKKAFFLSESFLIIYGVGVLNWGLYALSHQSVAWPLAFISFLQLFFVLILLFLIRRNDGKSPAHH